jgi:quinol monooxygenase YgiN
MPIYPKPRVAQSQQSCHLCFLMYFFINADADRLHLPIDTIQYPWSPPLAVGSVQPGLFAATAVRFALAFLGRQINAIRQVLQMSLTRRSLVIAAAVTMTGAALATTHNKEKSSMFGLIGKMKCTPGQRDTLIAILLEGVSGMPGCLSYVVAKDPTDPDAVWITEAWESQDRHKASLSLPSVQAAITKARPIIAGFGERFETEPVGGHGLGTAKSVA